MSLTPKQAAFVREYAVDKNGTQAAIRAGYSPKTANEQAARLLVNASVRSAVDALLAKLAEKTETDAEWVRRRLREEAEDFTEFSSQSARVRAIEIVAKLNGMFELDNKQQAIPHVLGIRLVPLKSADGGEPGPESEGDDA